jgi:hypothetical protein
MICIGGAVQQAVSAFRKITLSWIRGEKTEKKPNGKMTKSATH